MTVSNSLENAAPLSIDADGNGEEDTSLTGTEDTREANIIASLEILSGIVAEMGMDPALKEIILKKLLLAEIRLEKGKAQKAKQALERIMIQLEREVKRNEHLRQKEEGFTVRQQNLKEKIDDHIDQKGADETVTNVEIKDNEDQEDKKELIELEKEAKKDSRLQRKIKKLEQRLLRRSDRWEEWRRKHPGERITTENANWLRYYVFSILQKWK